MKQEELPCEVCTDAESAVKDADIIVTVTTATRPILKKDWIKNGAHINGKQKIHQHVLLASRLLPKDNKLPRYF